MLADHLAIELAEEIERLIGRIRADLEQLQVVENRKQPEILSDLFRSAHSLKAVFSTGRLDKQAKMAHEFERMIDNLRLGYLGADRSAIKKLSDMAGILENDSRDFRRSSQTSEKRRSFKADI